MGDIYLRKTLMMLKMQIIEINDYFYD